MSVPGGNDLAFLAGGRVGALMRAHDWSTSPLGPPETWPQSLRSIVGLMLSSPFPMFVAWGEELGFVYNDAYAEILGAKHPAALGRRFRDIWSEIWPDIEPLVAAAMDGQATWRENLPLVMNRKGHDEETWFTFGYSPVRDESGAVAGMYCACTETTAQVLAERRQAFLLALEERLRDSAEPRAAMDAAVEALGRHLGISRAGYSEVLPDGETIHCATCYADGVAPILGTFRLEDFGPESVERQRHGATDVCVDVVADPAQVHATWAAIETRAFVSVPLVRDGRLIASLYVNSREPRRWSPDTVSLVEDVAARTWAAVERARAEERVRASEARLAFLDRLGTQTAPLADADAVLATTMRLLGEHLRVSICAYADMDADADGFTIRDDWTAPGAASIVGRYRLADFGQLAMARLGAGLPLVVHDVARELAPAEAATFRSIGIAATICVPLVKEGRLTALMAIHDRVPRVWTEAETSLLREVTARSWAHVERVAAAAELRASEARLRAVFEQAAAGLARTDPTGRFVEVNDRYCAIVGRSREALSGLAMQDITHPEDLAANLPLFAAAAAGGPAFDIEKRYVRPDGSVAFVRNSVSGVREDGAVSSVLAVSIDISERKRAEARLAESEARLERALEAGALGAWELDLATLAAWRSPQHDRIFGYAAMLPEWTYDMFLDHILPEDRGMVDASFRKAIADGGRWDFECRIRRADAQVRWISAQGEVELGDGAGAGRVKGMVRDVTERKRAEEALRELNETLARRVEERTAERDRMWRLSTDVMLVARVDGTVEAFNPAWTALLGWTEGDIGGADLLALVHEDDRDLTRAELARLAEGTTTLRFENRYRGRDGAYRWLSWTAVPDAGLIHAVGRDVTAEKEQARALAQAEEQLRQSRKLEAMGQLTGGVAHDFNNLLTPIIGPLDMLVRRGIGSERERRLLDGALQSAERAKVLVQRLLAFARRQPLRAAPIDLAGLVRGMADLIGSTLGPTIEIRVALDEALPSASADANQIEMALLNLSVNARDAMPDGGTLTISAAPARAGTPGAPDGLAPGDYVRLTVSDTGIGMDEATRARAIEPFFTTKGLGKGTGLGLSMVHGLAAQLGGGLAIESERGRGTHVHVGLPGRAAGAGAADAPDAAAPPAPAARGTALVVDDEDLVRASVADMLMELGFDVVEATSGEEALALIAAGHPVALLVTDHLMPGMSGVDLARAARRRRPDLAVLVVSGYADVDDIAPDLPRLAKPFRPADLAARIGRLMPEARAVAS
ncbi:PAS domain S-box protein [Salinarimonas sp.]|uniref:PAS domain S-box protein n=1 Tax=Salinarimonas sp. TaxID=2766526 RepID=UPI00391BA1BA